MMYMLADVRAYTDWQAAENYFQNRGRSPTFIADFAIYDMRPPRKSTCYAQKSKGGIRRSRKNKKAEERTSVFCNPILKIVT